MRDIKFRAWDEENKKMYTWQDILEMDRNTIFSIIFEGIKMVAMQWTGLMDENGKDIYEDDLINVDGDIYRVMFKEEKINWFGEGRYFINFLALQSVKDELDTLPLENSFGIVVGNIYENPELLKAKWQLFEIYKEITDNLGISEATSLAEKEARKMGFSMVWHFNSFSNEVIKNYGVEQLLERLGKYGLDKIPEEALLEAHRMYEARWEYYDIFIFYG